MICPPSLGRLSRIDRGYRRMQAHADGSRDVRADQPPSVGPQVSRTVPQAGA